MKETDVPVFLIAGFLESGKTTFLRFTLDQEYFQIDGKTLLILCEEGEVEYNQRALARNNTVVEVIESEEELTTQKLNTLAMLPQSGACHCGIQLNVAGQPFRVHEAAGWMGD